MSSHFESSLAGHFQTLDANLQKSFREILQNELPLVLERTLCHTQRRSSSEAAERVHNHHPGAAGTQAQPRKGSCSSMDALEDDDDDIPLMHKGFLAKKVYDGMAPLVGLESQQKGHHSHDQPHHGSQSRNGHHTHSNDSQALHGNGHRHCDHEKNEHIGQSSGVHPLAEPMVINSVDDDAIESTIVQDLRTAARNTSESPALASSVTLAWEENEVMPIRHESKEAEEEQHHDLRLYGMTKTMSVTQKNTLKLGHSGSVFVHEISKCESCLMFLSAGAKRIVEGAAFDSLAGSAVILYTCMIGIQTEWVAQNLDTKLPVHFTVFEVIFCTIFFLELVARFLAGRKHFFCGDSWRWNVLDTVLVILQVADLILETAMQGSANTNMSFMRVLRVLRLIRVVRLVRVVRLMGELRSIVSSIMSSLKSLFFTLILIFFLVFTIGVFFTQLVTDKLQQESDNADLKENLKLFKTLTMSVLVLYQSLTGGIDWGDASQSLMDNISPVLGLVYALYISFGVLCMLNVVTGVFVESACKSSAEENDANMVARLQSFLCRTDDDGVITWEEFEARLDDPEILLYFQTVDLDVSEALGLFRLLDTDNSGTVEAEEFVMGCLRLRGFAKAVDLATLMYENRRWHKKMDRMTKNVDQKLAVFADRLSEFVVSVGSLPADRTDAIAV